jgi:hypothetical protein
MKRRCFQLVLTLFALFSGVAMADAKDDSESLLNAALPIAEKMLKEHGEFYPYAFTLRADGTTAMVAGYDGHEKPPSLDVIDLLKKSLRADAAAHKIVASAIVSDVLTTDPSTGVKTDAISVALDHRDHYSIVVLLRYKLHNSSLDVASPTAQKGMADIFAQ